jgi:hypothetical protein
MFGKKLLWDMAAVVIAELGIASYIEMTRFPVSDGDSCRDTRDMGRLVRAADLIGQIEYPNRLRKCPALFYEFQEIGLNQKL